MYQCFHCLHESVVWDADYDLEDFGIPGSGVIHICHCTNCGAEIHVISKDDMKNVYEKAE